MILPVCDRVAFLLWIFYGIELVFSCQVTCLLFGRIFSVSLHIWRSVLLSVDDEYEVNGGAHFFWLILGCALDGLHRNKQVPLLEDTYFSDPIWNDEMKLNKAEFKSLMHLELRKSVSFQPAFQSFMIFQITQSSVQNCTISFANNSSLWLTNVTDLFYRYLQRNTRKAELTDPSFDVLSSLQVLKLNFSNNFVVCKFK